MGFFDKIKNAVPPIGGFSPFGMVKEQETMSNNESQPQPMQPASSAEGLYDPQLEKLIDLALADGELTEKEKQVLFKKAEAMGVDLDEFEMVLEARLYERTNSAPAVSGTSASPSSNKFGDIKKCPSCGAIIQSFTTRCVECGFEFRNTDANQGVQRLFEMLNDIDNQTNTSSKGGFWGMFDEEQHEANKIKRKTTIIKNFPIPTTKDDILEFLILSVPQAKVKTSIWNSNDDHESVQLAPAWKAKCEQIIMKAKFAMKDDKDFMEEISKYAKELKINI